MSALYFPQLTTGAIAQYPIARRWSRPTATNVLSDGSTFVLASPRPPQVRWQLQFRGLTSSEWSALETLFTATQGRYGSFVFLDPTANLLAWSEDMTAPIWTSDPLISIQNGAEGPFGATSAASIVNNGQSPQRISQHLVAPGWFQYTFSVYLRAPSACQVSLFVSTDGRSISRTAQVTQNWYRSSLTSALPVQTEDIQFGIEIPSGIRIFASGPQVEPQAAAGFYKPTVDANGVYSKSRFDQDTLLQDVDTLGYASTTVAIITNG